MLRVLCGVLFTPLVDCVGRYFQQLKPFKKQKIRKQHSIHDECLSCHLGVKTMHDFEGMGTLPPLVPA